MSLNEKHFANIIKANNDNRLAIFVGAGISKSSETSTVKIPTWNDLIRDLKADLGLPKEENDYLKIAQLYFLEFHEFTYYEKLKSYFPNNIEPSLIHKLIFDINPQSIITTNWDSILEKAIENNAYIYDIASSDEDLVKSTLQKKLIKMHGDFKNHNIVFKEDDYLSYQYNFPIIENYIKSILSTHTILFLGYSYNDVNLKQIMKWLQNHSKVSPPRYLISFQQNPTQEKYLSNHNITVLTLIEEDKKFKELDSYSRKLATFLNLLVNPRKAFLAQNDDEIVKYIYRKLTILDSLDGILLEQIKNSLTNCGFVYSDDNLVLLELYSNILTTDFNEEERAIHAKFIKLLKKYDNNEYNHRYFNKIFNILIKANIDGIVISTDNSKKEYIDIKKASGAPAKEGIVNICFNFNFSDSNEKSTEINKMAELAYQHYHLKNYENAYNILEEVVTLCLKQRNYTQLFLSMFNRNLILQNLKYFPTIENSNKYQAINEYNLKEKFNTLPKDLQKALEPIYYFVNFDYLYRYAFNVSKELTKKEDAKRTIEQGGMVFNSNITESASKHKNLVLFVLRNKIMIDGYVEYKTINKYLLEISIIRQTQANSTFLNKIELYSCLKYLDHKELKILFQKFNLGDSTNKNSLTISEEDKLWLSETVIFNLADLFIVSNNMISNHENSLQNAIFLLSLICIEKDQVNKIMSVFLRIIAEAKNTIGVYESINQFLGMQYKLFKLQIEDDDLIKLIEIILNKFVYKKYNGFDYHAITSNSINNLYGYARENKAIFNNNELVTRLLLEIKNLAPNEKIRISQSLLLNVYDISNDEIKKDIREYILGIDINKDGENLTFDLLLFIRGLKKFDVSIVDHLDQYIRKFDGTNQFSTILYTLKEQFRYLVHEMSNDNFLDLLNKTEQAIANYEQRRHLSVF
jgi:hypothetical protein